MNTTTPRHWQVVSELFNDALELPPEERRAFLERSCEDEEMLREVLDLVADEERDGDGLLARPYFSLHKKADEPEPEIGRRVGSYRLVRRLGHGGMGTVYLAERADGEFEQQVAVKLLHPGLLSDDAARRFQSERQILARLSHPNVAQLLDGGTTGDGLPYFVMEHVDGQPIDAHCDQHQLSIRQRLRLFLSVCAAVSFAHRNLVVHRDLKPGNVLVTPDGRVKLLDFGIAKLLEGRGLLATQKGLAPMTPPYASPEQIRGEAVSTASDVYSLGVVLYELLTGRRPHETDSPESLARAICEEDPRRPSTVVPGEKLRIEEPKRWRRGLAGDLDNIVLKAIRKEPERRFSSVEQLSEDVRRHLEGLPVLSRPDTFAYRTGKFVRRHRWGVAAATLVVLMAGAFTISTAVQNARIARQYEEILRERDRARNVTEFLVDVLGTPDPRRAKGETPTVLEILEDTLRQLGTEMREEPLIRASLLDAIGRVYLSLRLRDEARAPLEEALELRRAHLGAEDPVLAESLHNLAKLERADGRVEEAKELIREAIAIQRGAFAGDHSDLARGLSNLSSLLGHLGRFEDAEASAREALEMQRRLFGDDHVDVAVTLNNLAHILASRKQPAEAERLYQKSIEIRRRFEGPDDPGLAQTYNNLAALLVNQLNRPGEAAPLYRESLRIRQKVFGDDHPALVVPLNNFAVFLTTLGRYEEARSLLDKALATCGDGPNRPVIQKNRTLLLAETGDHAACERLAREVLPRLRQPAHVAEAKSLRGFCLAHLGRHDEAEPLLREGYEALSDAFGEDDRRTRQAGDRLAAFTASAPRSR